MDEQVLTAAAEQVMASRLARRRLTRLDGLDSLEDAYRVQQRANAGLERHLGARIGHKIGGTTETMRHYLRAPEPMAGEIFAHQCHPDGASISRAGFVRLGIETEIAVRLADDLPPRTDAYTRADMTAVVGEVMAAIELVDDRYEDFSAAGVATLIADNAFDAGSVLGAPAPGWHRLDLAALTARTFHDDRLLAEGCSDVLLGHPLDALAWLANCRSKLGLGLTAGTFVSLGTITPVHWVEAAGTYRIAVEALGEVTVVVD